MTVTRDGLAYLDVAGDILEGRWFSDPTYTEAIHFPPGLSILLASVATVTGVGTTVAAGIVNLVALVGAIVGLVLYLRRQGAPARLIVVSGALVGVSTVLLRVNVKVLTEGAFVACLVVVGVALDLDRRRPGTASFALLVAGCAGAAWLRYPGVTAALGAATAMVLWDRSIRIALRGAALLVLTWVPLIAWMLSVSASAPAELREHSPSSSLSLGEVAHSISALGIAALGGSYDMEGKLYGRLDLVARLGGAALGLVIIGLLVVWWAAALRDLTRHGRAAGSSSAVAMVVLLYVSFVTLTRFLQGYSVLDRYWLPVLVLGLLGAASATRIATPRWQMASWAGLLVLLGANLVGSVVLLAHNAA
jgi:hypothetical protein